MAAKNSWHWNYVTVTLCILNRLTSRLDTLHVFESFMTIARWHWHSMSWPRGQPPPNPSPHKNTLAVSGTWIGDWSWKRKKWRQQLRLSAARRATWPDGLQVPWETACDEWEQAWPCSGSSAGIFCSFPGRRPRRACVHIAAATLSGNSLRQTVHTHRACVYQAAN